MKSKRRHELQHNVLDAELGKVIAFFKKRGTQIAWGVLIAALIVFVVVYVRGRSREERDKVLADYNYGVRSLDTLGPRGGDEVLALFKELSRQDTDERIAAMACVYVGDLYFARMVLWDSEDSHAEPQSLAEDAATWYRRAFEEHPREYLAAAKAHVGLAKLAESKLDSATARNEYQAAVQSAAKASGGSGQLVTAEADLAMNRLDIISAPVPMATTLPAPATQPATQPATAPATQPTTQPATGPATKPATQPA